ncbi:Glutaredoxin family protein [Euphorbia peplus]|nr:Glutaredoxin family protein [Euphorbia peplus]
MSGFDNNMEFKGKSKPNTMSPSLFSRSFTVRSSTKTSPRDYLHPHSKFYNSTIESMKGKVKKLCNIFETSKSAKAISVESHSNLIPHSNKHLKAVKSMGADYNRYPFSDIRLPGTEDRIVVYLTSLRGIRRTFEDCYAVRMIFRGFRVWVDERDISMDSAYKKELQSVLGEKYVSLPQVFIKGKHVGGAEVIKQMYETGELAKILDGFPKRDSVCVCEGCGDARFKPCGNCSGSRKIFDEDEDVLKRCVECNENGLIRCPDCCS